MSEPKLVNPDDPVFPKEVHNLLVAANATNITLSGMADTKASILMGASFVVFSMSISDIAEGKASLPLLVVLPAPCNPAMRITAGGTVARLISAFSPPITAINS